MHDNLAEFVDMLESLTHSSAGMALLIFTGVVTVGLVLILIILIRMLYESMATRGVLEDIEENIEQLEYKIENTETKNDQNAS